MRRATTRRSLRSGAATALGLAIFAAGCGSGGGGDARGRPPGDALGPGKRIYRINDPASPEKAADRTQVDVTGAVLIAKDDYDETGDGKSTGNLYVQDARLPDPPFHAGITVYGAGFSPPDLRVAPGDVIDVSAEYQEFGGPYPSDPSKNFAPGQTLPELANGTARLRFESTVPAPVDVGVKDLYEYSTGRRWIGMLVRVKDIHILGDPKVSGGRFDAAVDLGPGLEAKKLPTISNALSGIDKFASAPKAGAYFSSVVGVVQYFYNFKITPRSEADLVP